MTGDGTPLDALDLPPTTARPIPTGTPNRAIELLEQGRSIYLTQLREYEGKPEDRYRTDDLKRFIAQIDEALAILLNPNTKG